MATTNLIVDFLVIGLFASVWVVPTVAIVLKFDWLEKFLQAAEVGGTGPTLIILLSLAYVLGIALNRLADELTAKWSGVRKREIFGKEINYHKCLNRIIIDSEPATDYLGYRRSVIRTCRACGLSSLLSGLAWLSLALFRPELLTLCLGFFIFSLGVLLSVILFYSWATVENGYLRGIKDMCDNLSAGVSEE